MTTVHAPYNFVPVSGKVVLPEWGEQISHDVPFSDGLSGEFGIRLEAKTPLCVGDRKQDGVLLPFTDADGKPAIPGSSIRGMLRNVVEIVSFARMQYVDVTRRYAVRDLHNRELYTNKITRQRPDGSYEPMVRSGWLQLRKDTADDDKELVEIQACNHSRVEFSDLLAFLRNRGQVPSGAEDLFGRGKKASMAKKYEAWEEAHAPLSVDFEPEPAKAHSRAKPGSLYFSRAQALGVGKTKGQLVFTGQPGPSKHREFVFYGADGPPLAISEDTYRDFRFNHAKSAGERHGGEEEPNDEWNWWKAKLRAGGQVPVFFLTDASGRVVSFGLAQMYRLAYTHTIGDTLGHTSPDHHRHLPDSSRGLDLVEGIFGRVTQGRNVERDDVSLRGRVAAGMFRLEKGGELSEPYRAVLGHPKPTFYPSYIQQNPGKDGCVPQTTARNPDYRTYMDAQAELRGWKRYPTRNKVTQPPEPGKGQDNVASQWRACNAGSVFTGRIRFHNLRPAELGAILWAIDFGGQAELRHSLGYAKPFGFGVIKLSLGAANIESLAPDRHSPTVATCREAFVKFMEGNLARGTFLDSEQLVQLLAMADPSRPKPEALVHMSLGDVERDKVRRGTQEGGGNEFVEAKKRGAVLLEYAAFPRDDVRDRKLYPRETSEQRKQRRELAAKEKAKRAEQDRLIALRPRDKVLHAHGDWLQRLEHERLDALVGAKDKAVPTIFTSAAEYKTGLSEAFGDTIEHMRLIAGGNGPALKKYSQLQAQLAAAKPQSPQHREFAKRVQKAQDEVEREKRRGERYRAFLVWLDDRS